MGGEEVNDDYQEQVGVNVTANVRKIHRGYIARLPVCLVFCLLLESSCYSFEISPCF